MCAIFCAESESAAARRPAKRCGCGRDVARVYLVSWRRPRAVRPERTRSARPSPAVFVFAFALSRPGRCSCS